MQYIFMYVCVLVEENSHMMTRHQPSDSCWMDLRVFVLSSMPCLTVFFAKASHYFTLLQHYMYMYINVYILTTASYCLSHFICHTFMYTHTYIYTQRRRVNTLGSTNNTNMHTNICMFFGFCRHLCYRFFVSVRNVFLTLTPWQFHSHICRQFSTRLFATR